MKNNSLDLKEVDSVEITTLMDNYVDVLLGDTEIAKRPPLSTTDEIPKDTFVAEHGLSLLINVKRGNESHTILLDTGYTENGVLHNMQMLNIDPDSIESIVISHAHMDHTGSLYSILDSISLPITMVVHPYAFNYPRFLINSEGKRTNFPKTLIKEDLEKGKNNMLISDRPSLIAGNMIAVTGEIDRITDFENGMPNAYMEIDGDTVLDLILDDQALAINLKGKGLVIVTGCSHSGIVNTMYYARKITGIEKIYGILGGFHLTGQLPEHVIANTIHELKKAVPQLIVPMHCTGWNSIRRIQTEFSDSFVLNSVGTKYILQ